MSFYFITGISFMGVGAIVVYFARFLLKSFLPGFMNEKGILTAKLIGLTLVVLGAFIIFFSGVSEFRSP